MVGVPLKTLMRSQRRLAVAAGHVNKKPAGLDQSSHIIESLRTGRHVSRRVMHPELLKLHDTSKSHSETVRIRKAHRADKHA